MCAYGDKPGFRTVEYIYRVERRHRAVVSPEQEIVKKELALLKRLADEIEARLPPGLQEDERVRQGIQVAAADPGLSRLVAELVELAELRGGSVLRQRPGTDG